MNNRLLVKKQKHFCEKFIFALWSLMALAIMLILLFLSHIDYNRKQPFLLSNLSLLGIGALIFAVTFFLYKTLKNVISISDHLKENIIYFLTVALFLLSTYIISNIYFTSGWDSNIIIKNARYLSTENYKACNTYYYSNYPNNLFVTGVYSLLFKINSLFGIQHNEELFVAYIQAALMSVTGLLLFKIVKSISKPSVAYIAWAVFVLHIGLSPWIGIIYTDASGLILPTTLLYIYFKTQNNSYSILKWSSIGALVYFGYKIKPQIAIVGIAIMIVDLLQLWKLFSLDKLKNSLKNYAALVLAFVISLTVYSGVISPAIKIEIDSNKTFSIIHFVKMGLNSETDGAYLLSDVEFSRECETQKERKAENLKVIRERLSDYGVGGFAKHTIKKTLVNYGDGTYAWSREGNFYNITRKDVNEFSAPLLKSIFYKGGKYYNYFITFQQFVWVNILFCSLGIGLYYIFKKKVNPIISVMVLSLIGLTIFSTVFEARARYLFIYTPFYVMVAVLGAIGIVKAVANIYGKIKEKL